MSFLENLNWRYATKKFDSTKKVTDEIIQKIRDAVRMAPTSYGLQMFSVLEVENVEIREKLKEVSWGQSQVTDADRLFIFLSRADGEKRIEDMFSNMSGGNEEIRKTALAEYENMVRGSVLSKDKESLLNWSAKQSYIALGFAMAAAAELNIDSCPMEGFDPIKAKEILGLDDDFMPAVFLPIGYRDESDQSKDRPKWRFPENHIFTKI